MTVSNGNLVFCQQKANIVCANIKKVHIKQNSKFYCIVLLININKGYSGTSHSF